MSDPERIEAELARFRKPAGRAAPILELAPMREALADLGDPHLRLPPVIHVTGTNGKGSTTAFIRSMADACGLRAHVFTSPHLVRVNERIRVAGRMVEDDMLFDALCEVADRTRDLTYFEALTAAALWLFAENPAELAVIEVGAGGATDATNVFVQPLAAVMTAVDRDHEALFGVSGVAAIARIKAGIFREGCAAVIARQAPVIRGVLLEEARKVGAVPKVAGREWKADWSGEAFVFSGERIKVRAPWLGLAGRHQADNAGVACAAFETLVDRRVSPDGMAAGLRGAIWPGRLQKLEPGPLLGDWDGEIIIDAAHNPAGARVLAAAIQSASLAQEGGRPALVFAAQAAKDVAGILSELAPVVRDVFACPLPDSGGQEGGAGASPGEIVAMARSLGGHAMPGADFREAIRLAKAGGATRIYVCGSIYLCGAVLAANGQAVA